MSYADAVLVTNPVGYWLLGEKSGTVARDEMGANDGVYNGSPTLGVAGLLAGDSDTAMGGSDPQKYMSVSSAGLAALFSGTGPWTVAMWVDEAAGDWSFLFSVDNCGASHVHIRHTAAFVYVERHDASTAESCEGAPLSAGGKFLVVTYDGATIRPYLGGALGTPAASTMSLPSLAPVAAFGANISTGGNNATATYDEPAIWDRALTAPEVAALYAAGTTAPALGRSQVVAI